jgi:hypothetical protein
VKALAVDNEPEPFWNGSDETGRIDAWLRTVNWRPEWGEAKGVGHLNGSSGVWLQEEVLAPLRVPPGDAWITDCLDTYYLSSGAEKRLRDTYDVLAKRPEVGLPAWSLPSHPSEKKIVELAAGQVDRLRRELATARPKRIVTLGNAALSVFRQVAKVPPKVGPAKLAMSTGYGSPVRVELPDLHEAEWLPLAHPGAPEVYQHAHSSWKRTL